MIKHNGRIICLKDHHWPNFVRKKILDGSNQTSVSMKHVPGKLSVNGTPTREEKKKITTTTGRKTKSRRKATGYAVGSDVENTKSDTKQVLILRAMKFT